MPDRRDEERLARFIEKLWRHEFGFDPGPERLHEPAGYDVDFLYPRAHRPTALEITSLRSATWESGKEAARRYVPSLDAVASHEQLGDWRLHLTAAVNVKAVQAGALSLMRRGEDGGGTGWRIERVADTPHQVRGVTTQWSRVGRDPSLQLALTALENINKLAITKPAFETHLAISTHYGQLPRLPTDVHVPPCDGGFEALAALDWVWVIPRVGQPDEPTAWFAHPGDLEWHTSHLDYDHTPV
jgi:hypothetical protein